MNTVIFIYRSKTGDRRIPVKYDSEADLAVLKTAAERTFGKPDDVKVVQSALAKQDASGDRTDLKR